MNKISILIPSFNSEKTIEETLESVKWADEILICDSFSSDKTLEIARKYNARIIQHEYINSAAQKNWAIPQCSYNWIFIVDTDEVFDAGLKEEILKIISREDVCQAYRVPRKNYVYGKWMKHGGLYPDYQTRLFKKESARYEEREVHADMVVQGKTGTIQHHLLHQGFKDVREWFLKTERYVRYESDEFLKRGRRYNFFRTLFYPPVIFFRNYFFKFGFLHGYRGFLMASLDSFYYLMVNAKLFERNFFRK